MKIILIASQMLTALSCATAQPQSPTAFRGAHPVAPLANGNLLIEAEEFQPTGKDGWRASGKPFKRNGDRVVLNLDVADALILR